MMQLNLGDVIVIFGCYARVIGTNYGDRSGSAHLRNVLGYHLIGGAQNYITQAEADKSAHYCHNGLAEN